MRGPVIAILAFLAIVFVVFIIWPLALLWEYLVNYNSNHPLG